MTRPRNDGNDTAFSGWIRRLPPPLNSSNYDFNNIDEYWYMWFGYREAWFILIEEKTFGADLTDPQRDSFGILNQFCTHSSPLWCDTWRGKRQIYYRGLYVVRFSHAGPLDSDEVEINGSLYRSAIQDVLKSLLRNGKLP